MLIKNRPTESDLPKDERNMIQQPLHKDGYSNDSFNELYGKDKNPYLGTERDRGSRKTSISLDSDKIPETTLMGIWGIKKYADNGGTNTKYGPKSKATK